MFLKLAIIVKVIEIVIVCEVTNVCVQRVDNGERSEPDVETIIITSAIGPP